MTGRTVPLSVRISQEDAEFLASLEVDGAATLSEKLRSLIVEARKKSDTTGGFSESQAELRHLIEPLIEKVQNFEADSEQYSQLLHLALEWVPDAMAELIAQHGKMRSGADSELMLQLERRVTDRVFRLIEGFLRLAVTDDCEGYDSLVVKQRLPRIRQLMELMRLMEQKQGDAGSKT